MSHAPGVLGGPLVVCTSCPVPHYVNCGTCRGWGVSHAPGGDVAPHGPSDPHARYPAVACPECGSDWRGLPRLRAVPDPRAEFLRACAVDGEAP